MSVMRNWLTVLEAADEFAKLHPFGEDHRDAVLFATIEVVDAAKHGKVGMDLARTFRNAFGKYGSQGWNEDMRSIEDPTILDALETAVTQFDGGFYIQEIAIQMLMDESTPDEQKRAIQEALWEFDTYIRTDWGTPRDGITVFEPVQETSPIEQHYDEEIDGVVLVKLNGAKKFWPDGMVTDVYIRKDTITTQRDDVPYETAPSVYVGPTLEDDRPERIPPWQHSGYDEDLVTRKIMGFAPKEMRDRRWDEIIAKLKPMVKDLTDLEVAHFINAILNAWYGTDGENPLRSEALETFHQLLDIDIEDDWTEAILDQDWYIWDHNPILEINGTREKLERLPYFFALPAEHPKWKPWHDAVWLSAGGFATSRISYPDAQAKSKKAWKQHKDRQAKNRSKNRGSIKVDKLTKSGIQSNGRLIGWQEFESPNVAALLDGGIKERLTTAIVEYEIEEAYPYVERIS